MGYTESFLDYIENETLSIGIENSLYNYYAFLICNRNDKYIVGLSENNIRGEYIPIVTEVSKTDNSFYEFILSPNVIDSVLEQNKINDPDFLGVVTLRGSITNFLYARQSDVDYFIPFSSEYDSKLVSGKAYNSNEIIKHIESIKIDDGLYGGYASTNGSWPFQWGAFIIVTLLFFAGGVLCVRSYKKRAS